MLLYLKKASPKLSTSSQLHLRNSSKAPSWLPRGEAFIVGVNCDKKINGMGMGTPITNRMFQVNSAPSKAARVKKASTKVDVEQGLIRPVAKAANFDSAAVAYHSEASYSPPSNAPTQ